MIVMCTDFGPAEPYTDQMRAVLAQHAPGVPVISLFNDLPAWDIRYIIRILDKQKLSVRKAAEKTGFDHADFSWIRNADLGRFTIDRLVTVLNRLTQHVEIKVTPFRGRRLKTA